MELVARALLVNCTFCILLWFSNASTTKKHNNGCANTILVQNFRTNHHSHLDTSSTFALVLRVQPIQETDSDTMCFLTWSSIYDSKLSNGRQFHKSGMWFVMTQIRIQWGKSVANPKLFTIVFWIQIHPACHLGVLMKVYISFNLFDICFWMNWHSTSRNKFQFMFHFNLLNYQCTTRFWPSNTC